MKRIFSVLTLVALTTTLAACTPTANSTKPTTTTTVPSNLMPDTPAVDLAATPPKWIPVAFGNAQISIPATFDVTPLEREPCVNGLFRPGMLFLGMAPKSAKCLVARRAVRPRVTLVHLRYLTRPKTAWSKESAFRVNGVNVYSGNGDDPWLSLYGTRGHVYDYLVPVLGTELSAVGPLAAKVVGTLTVSPRVVALHAGPAPSVPSSWREIMFGGVEFAAPRSWHIDRTSAAEWFTPPCSIQGVWTGQPLVVLDTDRFFVSYNCGLEGPSVPNYPLKPANRVGVDIGPHAPTVPVSALQCFPRAKWLCVVRSEPYSVLALVVRVPGRSKPVIVSIGLGGSGVVARTILYSMKLAK